MCSFLYSKAKSIWKFCSFSKSKLPISYRFVPSWVPSEANSDKFGALKPDAKFSLIVVLFNKFVLKPKAPLKALKFLLFIFCIEISLWSYLAPNCTSTVSKWICDVAKTPISLVVAFVLEGLSRYYARASFYELL